MGLIAYVTSLFRPAQRKLGDGIIIHPGPGTSGGGGSFTPPTGTGFIHVTSGAMDAASKTVDLASADVTGVLPTGNQASQSLAGDATGTTAASTVAKINATTVTTAGGALTTGKVLRVTGAAASDWGAVDLANASAVTGTLPTGNQASQAMAGDVTGTTAAATVAKVNATTVTTAGGALTTGKVLRVTGAAASDWGALDLANASAVTGTLPTGNQASQALGGSLAGTTAAGTVVQVDGSGGTVTFATTAAIMSWAAASSAPTIKQVDNTTNSATAQNLTVQAQNATGTSATGGNLNLTSGTGTGTKGTLNLQVAGTTVASLTQASGDFLKLGAGNVASAGLVRFPSGVAQVVARNNGNSGDITLLATDSSDSVYVGSTSAYNGTQAATLSLASNGSGNIGIVQGSTTKYQFSGGSCTFYDVAIAYTLSQRIRASDAVCNDLTIQSQAPFASATGTNRNPGNLKLTVPAPVAGGTTGNIQLTGSLVAGFVTQAMGDANQTLSDTNSAKNVIVTTGALTASRQLTINTPPTAGVIKFVRNNCTGNTITVVFSSGSATAAIAASASAIVYGDGTNAQILMTGT